RTSTECREKLTARLTACGRSARSYVRVCKPCLRDSATSGASSYPERGTYLWVCPFSPLSDHFGRYRRHRSSGRLKPFALVRTTDYRDCLPSTQGSIDAPPQSARCPADSRPSGRAAAPLCEREHGR